jgi:hypothetical protein
MGYIHNVLLSLDQLANTLCGGNPDNTISARVGYFAQVNRNSSKWYWKTAQKVIDFTYWPVDGSDHCTQAFEADPEEIFNDNNSDFFRFLMSLVIIAVCIPVSITLYFGWAILRLFGFKSNKQKKPEIAG